MKMNYLKMTLGVLAAALAVSGCASVEHTDVLVVGGGASGISAAVQTARMGVPVMVVEETPWVGGMLTSAGVSCIDGNYRLQGGIFGEFADSLAQRYGGWDALKTGWVSNINFEPSVGQEVLTNIAASCGSLLSLRRETTMLDVTREEDLWKVKLKDKEGKTFEIPADSVIMSVGYTPAPIANKAKHVHVIGDAAAVGNLRTVIWGAWDVAMKI